MADRAADDPAQDVSPALVRGQDPVGDQEGHRPAVVGDHLVAEALRLEDLGVMPHQLPHARVDRREDVRVEIAGDLLEDAREALEAHSGVDARERQRHATVRALLELHEDEVPDLEPPRAVLRMIRDAVRPLGKVGTSVEVDLAARAAWAGVGHPPEVVVVARIDVPPARHALRRQADLVAPDRPGDLVVGVRRGRQALARDPHLDREELPRPVDRLALEVVAEAPVAEHLEEGVVAGGPADLLEVVVLARHPQHALVVDRPGVAARLRAGEDLLELDHARVREEERLVAGRHEAGARNDRVSARGEEHEEAPPDVGRGERRDPGIVVGRDEWRGHRSLMVANAAGPSRPVPRRSPSGCARAGRGRFSATARAPTTACRRPRRTGGSPRDRVAAMRLAALQPRWGPRSGDGSDSRRWTRRSRRRRTPRPWRRGRR